MSNNTNSHAHSNNFTSLIKSLVILSCTVQSCVAAGTFPSSPTIPVIGSTAKSKQERNNYDRIVAPTGRNQTVINTTNNTSTKKQVSSFISSAITIPKVIGGNPTPINTYPWFTDLGGCGGVLVSPTFVLTAAHCWMLILPNQRIKVGHLCNAADNCGQNSETITVYGTHIHPDYTWLSNSPSHDVMLVQLNQRSSISPATLDLEGISPNYKSGKKLWTIGMGVVDANTGVVASTLKHAEIEYMSSNQCNTRYVDKITSSMMCAGFPGRDACQGDSGGPLYDEENDVWW
jgi:Secreted trypsin-like serine protease